MKKCDDQNICVSTQPIHYNGCEFCKNINADAISLNKCTNRILKVNVTLNNVCFEKEISIGVILCDKCGKIVAYKCFNAKLHKTCDCCCCNSCGTLKRTVKFILPESDICCQYDLVAHIVANYNSPCDNLYSCEY